MSALRPRAAQPYRHRDDRPTLLLDAPEGIPGAAHNERLRARRREQTFQRAAKQTFRLLVLLTTFLLGYHVGASRGPAQAFVDSNRSKAQQLAAGKMSCSLDQHEGCLICLHRDVAGQVIVASHC